MTHLEGIYESEDGVCHGFPADDLDFPCSAVWRGVESTGPLRKILAPPVSLPVWFDGERFHCGGIMYPVGEFVSNKDKSRISKHDVPQEIKVKSKPAKKPIPKGPGMDVSVKKK